MKRTYSQLDLDDRRKIERWRHAGVAVDVIAEKLGRHRSTIFRLFTIENSIFYE